MSTRSQTNAPLCGSGAETAAIVSYAIAEPAIVAVIEDDQRQREALAFQLETAGFRTFAYASARSFIRELASKEFDCLVADICMPEMNGLKLLEELQTLASPLSTILITGHGDISVGVQAMREGAVDCLEKPIDDQALLTVVRAGVERSRAMQVQRVKQLELRRRERNLTPREREVFALITNGLLNKQVGAALGPTEHTIKKHRARIMTKMGAGSFADLVRMSDILGITPGSGDAVALGRSG